MKGIGLVVSFIISFVSISQTSIDWQKTFGGNKGETFNNIILTSDGGYILAGFYNSDSSVYKKENTIGGAGQVDYWIAKIDSYGNLVWENTIERNKS